MLWPETEEDLDYSVARDLRTPLRAMNGFARILIDDDLDRLDHEGSDTFGGSRPVRCGWESSSMHSTLHSHSLLENLIGNAWKFTGKVAAPRVGVDLATGSAASTLLVRDNGVGFDMDHADKLFTPFRRLHGEREFREPVLASRQRSASSLDTAVRSGRGPSRCRCDIRLHVIFRNIVFTVMEPCHHRQSWTGETSQAGWSRATHLLGGPARCASIGFNGPVRWGVALQSSIGQLPRWVEWSTGRAASSRRSRRSSDRAIR